MKHLLTLILVCLLAVAAQAEQLVILRTYAFGME